MKTIKCVLASVILFGFCSAYGQFSEFSMERKGNVKSIQLNRYFPIENNQTLSGYYVWDESESFTENGKSKGRSFEPMGVNVNTVRFSFTDYSELEQLYLDPLWEHYPPQKGEYSIQSPDLIIYSSAKPINKDEKGNVIEANSVNKDGSVSYKEKFVYDHENNCVERKHFDKYGNLLYTVSYIYLYDSNGNWINQIVLLNGKLYCVNVREVTYY